MAIQGLEKDEITEPFLIGETYFIYRVLSRKETPAAKPFEGSHRNAIATEAKNFKRTLVEHEVFDRIMADSEFWYDDDAMATAGQRINEKVAEVIPPLVEGTSFEERMERVRIKVVPDFTPEEEVLTLYTYKVGPTEHVLTLGDFRAILDELPGIETLKGGEAARIAGFLKRRIQNDITDYQIEQRGYKNTQEMADYIATRSEEFIVDLVYNAEVTEKVAQPTGQDIRDYFRSHRDDFKKPLTVDVQQIIVGTEAEANLLRQRLVAGEATFEELVERHSIDEWSKTKNGIIATYEQGERRLDYLQPVVFGLEKREISEAFRAPGGYAVVRVLEIYPELQLEFGDVAEVVKASVWNLAKEARLLEFLEGIEKDATVEYIESNFQHMDDPADVLLEKEEQRVTITRTSG